MNKSALLLFPSLLLFSCGRTEENKIPLFTSPATSEIVNGEQQYLVNKLYEDDFDHMIEQKMSFPLFVYAAGCGTCDNFAIVIKDYIRLHKVIFPYMTLAVFNQSRTKTPSLSESAILFYSKGVLTEKVENVLDMVFSTKDLEKLMDKECYETGIEYISSSYTYLNSIVPLYTYHFINTISLPEEKEKEIPNSYSDKMQDGTSLLMRKEPESYPALYSYLKTNSIRSFFCTTEEKEALEARFGKTIEGDFVSLTFKNGSCEHAESVSII